MINPESSFWDIIFFNVKGLICQARNHENVFELDFAQRPAVVKPTTAPACQTTSGFGETGTLEGVINAAGVKQGKDVSSQDFLLRLFSSRAPPAVIKQNVIFKLFIQLMLRKQDRCRRPSKTPGLGRLKPVDLGV